MGNKWFEKNMAGFIFWRDPILGTMSVSERRSYILRCSLPWYLHYNLGWIEARRAIQSQHSFNALQGLKQDNILVVTRLLNALGVDHVCPNKLKKFRMI